jgi:MOSC domain-containing protein YiiM
MEAPRVVSIHVAPGRRLPMKSIPAVEAEAGRGLVGDRHHGSKHRHVTVQSRTELDEAGALHGAEIADSGTRRNITISHGPVPNRPGELLRIGPVLLEAVRIAAPCKLLDDTLGPGAQGALRRRAGTVFRVLDGGLIAVGDGVVAVADRLDKA